MLLNSMRLMLLMANERLLVMTMTMVLLLLKLLLLMRLMMQRRASVQLQPVLELEQSGRRRTCRACRAAVRLL